MNESRRSKKYSVFISKGSFLVVVLNKKVSPSDI